MTVVVVVVVAMVLFWVFCFAMCCGYRSGGSGGGGGGNVVVVIYCIRYIILSFICIYYLYILRGFRKLVIVFFSVKNTHKLINL